MEYLNDQEEEDTITSSSLIIDDDFSELGSTLPPSQPQSLVFEESVDDWSYVPNSIENGVHAQESEAPDPSVPESVEGSDDSYLSVYQCEVRIG